MNIIKLNIRFTVAFNRINPIGKTAIGCRITYLKKPKEFSAGEFINTIRLFTSWY